MPKLHSVNLGPSEHKRLGILAAAEGRSKSDLARELINRAWDKSPFNLTPNAVGGNSQTTKEKVK